MIKLKIKGNSEELKFGYRAVKKMEDKMSSNDTVKDGPTIALVSCKYDKTDNRLPDIIKAALPDSKYTFDDICSSIDDLVDEIGSIDLVIERFADELVNSSYVRHSAEQYANTLATVLKGLKQRKMYRNKEKVKTIRGMERLKTAIEMSLKQE